MRLSATADYAVRAAVELAATDSVPLKGEMIAQAQDIPLGYLENVLRQLKHAGVVKSQRGTDGGYMLARSAEEITVADVIRAVDGPLASVRDSSPEALAYRGTAKPLVRLWVAVRANLRVVLESVTLAALARDELPPVIDGDVAGSPPPTPR
jgi:Rrf2 family protein